MYNTNHVKSAVLVSIVMYGGFSESAKYVVAERQVAEKQNSTENMN